LKKKFQGILMEKILCWLKHWWRNLIRNFWCIFVFTHGVLFFIYFRNHIFIIYMAYNFPAITDTLILNKWCRHSILFLSTFQRTYPFVCI
jgi:hypothetical protein